MKWVLKTVFLAVSLAALAACKGDDELTKIPDGILSKEKYADVLADMALAESASNLNVKNTSPGKIDSVYAFSPLKENGVSRSEFDSATAFYSRNPDLYREVYEIVLQKLSEFEGSKKPTDSLKK